ncbi:MAG TPA: DinB family protein [Bacteroidia bacterium]|nr:DinB family protein [Bacteroidia bacterium]
MLIVPPLMAELSPYYQNYLNYLREPDLLQALENQSRDSELFYSSITEVQGSIRYAEGKWMLKEVFGHICDTERIMSYRALRIARKDPTPIEGFDENLYIPNSDFAIRSISNIFEEWRTIRKATESFFKNLREEAFQFTGIANQTPVSVKSILFFIIVHERHHQQVLIERYLPR